MGKAASISPPIDREAFRRWAAARPGRYERVSGEVVAMAPERAAHVRVKAAIWLALREAIRAAGLTGCEALADGVTVEIGEHTDYEPDAVVNGAARLPDDALVASNPLIVVEVVSPSSAGADTGAKLADYFTVPSIQHYLIVHPTKRQVIHHRRRESDIETRIVRSGPLPLEPPGIVVTIESFYA